MREFRITEKDVDSECRELRVEGELDLSVADRFQQRLDAAVAEELDVLVFLDQCDFIDSTGIAAIVRAHRSITGKGRRLLLCNPSGQVGRILAITGLSDNGLVRDSTDAALAGQAEESSQERSPRS